MSANRELLAAYRSVRSRLKAHMEAKCKTPRAHKRHLALGVDVACGCWTHEHKSSEGIDCPLCGATYLAAEVMEFPIWRCYDCGGGWKTGG